MRKTSFDEFNVQVQTILNLSTKFRELIHVAVGIGMPHEDLARVASSLVLMGYHRGEPPEVVAFEIADGLNNALQIYTQIAADGTVH